MNTHESEDHPEARRPAFIATARVRGTGDLLAEGDRILEKLPSSSTCGRSPVGVFRQAQGGIRPSRRLSPPKT